MESGGRIPSTNKKTTSSIRVIKTISKPEQNAFIELPVRQEFEVLLNTIDKFKT